MYDTMVTDLLDSSNERSKGTSLYLKMMRDVMSAYMNPDMSPIQRVRCVWLPVFMLRIWRRYIENHKEYTLSDNFLTLNCYSCIELNAHSLIQLMLHLKESNQSELFLPELFGSQPCESTFRQFRALSSTYSTVINCTLKEAASRLSKIQLQNEIMHVTSKNYVYPRLKAKFERMQNNHFDLPSKEAIYAEIERCQKDAIAMAKKFNLIDSRCPKNIGCKINLHTVASSTRKKSRAILTPNPVNIEHLDISNIKLKNYTGKLKNMDIDDVSPFIEIFCDDGKRTIIKKTSLCWLLREDYQKLSSDRLMRVRHTTRKKRLQANRNFKRKPNKCKFHKQLPLHPR